MSDLHPTLLFGLVTMGLSEVLRRQFFLAYGIETHSNCLYVLLVVSLFVTLYTGFTGA